MLVINRFPLLNQEPGAGGAAPEPVVQTPEKEPSFESVTKAMFDTVTKEMAGGPEELTPSAPKAAEPKAAEPAPPPEPDLAAPAFAPPPALPAQPSDAATLALLQQMQQTQAQMLERMQPVPRQEPDAKSNVPPTIREAMRDYQAPQRMAGETDASYSSRNQASVLDHWNQKNASWLREQSAEIARNAVAEYQSQIQQQGNRMRAEQALSHELDAAVAFSGFSKDAPQAKFLRQTLENEVRMGVAQGRFRGHTDESFRAGLRSWVETAKRHLAPPPPPPGTRPNLQVVDAPISAGGATAAPSSPQSTSPAAPKSFEEAMGNAFGQWKRNG